VLWLWILGILAALLLLICLLPLGVTVWIGTPVVAKLKIGPVKIQVAPSKPSKKKEKKPPKKKKEPADIAARLKKLPKPAWAEIRDSYHMLWPPAKRALNHLLRGIHVTPLDLTLTVAGADDPAAAAQKYGDANALVWTLMPVLEQLLHIPDPHIHLAVDFEAGKTDFAGRIGVSVRIGTLLAIGVGMGIPALKWLWKYRKKLKQMKQRKGADTKETNAAPEEKPAA